LKELAEENAKLARQQETAYRKVRVIAEKAIEGSEQAEASGELQRVLAESSRKTTTEKV